MKHKLFTLSLAIMASISAIFAESGECGENLKWDLTDGILTISGTGDMANYSYYSQAPWYSLSVDSIVIAEGVTGIGDYAFYSNNGMTSIRIPNGVTTIGVQAFMWARNLSSVDIPSSITEIKSGAFMNCQKLAKVNISDLDAWCKIKFADKDANPLTCAKNLYMNEEPATDIVISDAVTEIGDFTFYYCATLTSVELPNSITAIGKEAFYHCGNLKTINFPENVESIGDYSFSNNKLTSVVIPNSVKTIGVEAFLYSYDLTSVTIGDGVTSIGKKAFAYCYELNTLTIGNSVTEIGESAFNDCHNLTSVELPNSVTNIGNSAFYLCSKMASVNIPDNVNSIGEMAFCQCNMDAVRIPSSVTTIGKGAFSSCSRLTSIEVDEENPAFCSDNSVLFDKDKDTLLQYPIGKQDMFYTVPNSVTTIDDYAFSKCSKLTSITLPDNLAAIGKEAFSFCTGLTSVTIPENITSIGNSAFYNVANIFYSGDVAGSPWGARCRNGYVDGWLIYNDESKSQLLSCFAVATGEIAIPNTVTQIGQYAFRDCSNISSVIIPNTVQNIGHHAFYNCNGLTSVTISEGVENIDYSAFSSCTGLTAVTIPNSVTKIGSDAFQGCSSLRALTLGTGLAGIENFAFGNCSSLQSIICASVTPPARLGKGIFSDVDTSIPLYVPAESIEEYGQADEWKMFTDIRALEAEEVIIEDQPHATPDEYSVVIEWPEVENAEIYTITVTKGNDTICALSFSKQGQLLSVSYAPERRGVSTSRQGALQTTNGWKYTVTGLESGTEYKYSITALDDDGKKVYDQTIPFKTTGNATSIDQTNLKSEIINHKLIKDGQLLILRGDKTYTLQGQEVK